MRAARSSFRGCLTLAQIFLKELDPKTWVQKGKVNQSNFQLRSYVVRL